MQIKAIRPDYIVRVGLVSSITNIQANDQMRHGLFPKDDISERDSTESPVICPLRVYAPELMAEWLAGLKETAP